MEGRVELPRQTEVLQYSNPENVVAAPWPSVYDDGEWV